MRALRTQLGDVGMGAAKDLNESTGVAETRNANRSQADTRAALTARQLGVLRAVEEWIASRGWPPTHREIGARVGVPSVSAVDGRWVRDRHEAQGWSRAFAGSWGRHG